MSIYTLIIFSFQLFITDKKLGVLIVVMTSALQLLSTLRLDGRTNIQFFKSACSILYSQIKALVLSSLEGNKKGAKANLLRQLDGSNYISLYSLYRHFLQL